MVIINGYWWLLMVIDGSNPCLFLAMDPHLPLRNLPTSTIFPAFCPHELPPLRGPRAEAPLTPRRAARPCCAPSPRRRGRRRRRSPWPGTASRNGRRLVLRRLSHRIRMYATKMVTFTINKNPKFVSIYNIPYMDPMGMGSWWDKLVKKPSCIPINYMGSHHKNDGNQWEADGI